MGIETTEWSRVVARLFGVKCEDVKVDEGSVRVGEKTYRLDRDVVLLDERPVIADPQRGTEEDVRRSFSKEWRSYGAILPEHDEEFAAYFDLVDLESLESSVVIDLGCGSGRWSAKLAQHCPTIVLVDFSDATWTSGPFLFVLRA